jgi:PAS domain S-box-containing protein
LLDPDTRKITDANPFILKLLDYSLNDLVGKELFEIGLLQDENASQEMFDQLRRNDQVRYEDLPLESRTGRHQEVEVIANVYDENGQSVIQCNIRDITDRKKVEEHNKMLMAEVNHRSKNLLAVVQAIAKQTARRGDPATFIDRLCDRMDGLAASQDLLVRNEWRGVGVMDLVKAQIAHFKDLIGTRILIDGPPVQLSPVAAQGIGMALHELATNAAKYGSLSNLVGRVVVSWQISRGNSHQSDPVITLQWREECGPKITPPQHQGFGQLVLGRMAAAAVDGKADVDYRESGLCWTLTGSVADSLKGDRASPPEHHVT